MAQERSAAHLGQRDYQREPSPLWRNVRMLQLSEPRPIFRKPKSVSGNVEFIEPSEFLRRHLNEFRYIARLNEAIGDRTNLLLGGPLLLAHDLTHDLNQRFSVPHPKAVRFCNRVPHDDVPLA